MKLVLSVCLAPVPDGEHQDEKTRMLNVGDYLTSTKADSSEVPVRERFRRPSKVTR